MTQECEDCAAAVAEAAAARVTLRPFAALCEDWLADEYPGPNGCADNAVLLVTDWEVPPEDRAQVTAGMIRAARRAINVPSPAVAALERRLAPMPCGHPGACWMNTSKETGKDTGYCGWCAAIAVRCTMDNKLDETEAELERAEALAALVPRPTLLYLLAEAAEHLSTKALPTDKLYYSARAWAQVREEARALAARIEEAQQEQGEEDGGDDTSDN